MHIGVPLETHAGETRVAATPETVKKLVGQGHQVTVQAGAGVSASIPDAAYTAAGAIIGNDAAALGADLVLKVLAPTEAGTHLTIWVNDVITADFVDASRRHARGHLALQQHHEGSEVRFKDVEVRELPASR